LPHRITSVHKKAYSSVISCGHLGNWEAQLRAIRFCLGVEALGVEPDLGWFAILNVVKQLWLTQMSTPIDSVILALNAFEPVDYDVENIGTLYAIFQDFQSIPDRQQAIPAMLSLLERFPDAELGNPGPIVDELEVIAGYESQLIKSLHRQPTDLTVWMVNRVLNSNLSAPEQAIWLAELKAAGQHPKSSDSTKEWVEEFLEDHGLPKAMQVTQNEIPLSRTAAITELNRP
jgi:hypothetical protein